MSVKRRLRLNLASHPLKNQRFFYLLVIVCVLLILILAVAGGSIYFKFEKMVRDNKAAIREVQEVSTKAQRAESRFLTQIQEAAVTHQKKVDLINGFIFRKSFSWVDFLSTLEKCLPDSSYIVTMAPVVKSDSLMEVKFKVVTPNLNELLKLMTKLKNLKFKNVRLLGEDQTEDGLKISEIAFNYERTI
jgi:Tfp pilus assembly protein PilN